MYSYVKSLSTDFPNGIQIDQLTSAITTAITTPNFLSLNIDGDVVDIIFDSATPDVTTQLNAVITAYTPIFYNYASPYIVDNILTNTINGTGYKYFGNQNFERLYEMIYPN